MLTPVVNDSEIQTIFRLAEKIWPEHFTPLVGEKQALYMLKHMQSVEIIKRQVEEKKVHYFLIAPYLDSIGYIALVARAHSLFLSNFFIGWHYRSKGYGTSVLQEAEMIARGIHKTRITLRVNRANEEAIKFFHREGFKSVGSNSKKIGDGFSLDDILMAKVLK